MSEMAEENLQNREVRNTCCRRCADATGLKARSEVHSLACGHCLLPLAVSEVQLKVPTNPNADHPNLNLKEVKSKCPLLMKGIYMHTQIKDTRQTSVCYI